MEQPEEQRSKLARNKLPRKTSIVLGLVKTKDVEKDPTLVQRKRCQDTHGERDTSADKWSEGTPLGIETAHNGDRDARQSKQDQETSGEVEKTSVQSDGRQVTN